ncbi:tyrosine-type recombinase/integrase [Zavarzinella formosa]|uniref:tyrosine-type recombinase/integrase n=1 Tax=Zavarzinella formosa TaxID=360055 RepID=UPI0003115634|nr:hypothetical protein [Zavarzinella formosa]
MQPDKQIRMVTAFGETLSVRDWSHRHGIPVATIYSRLDLLRWSPEDAVSKGSKVRIIAAFGESLTVQQWSARHKVPPATICTRIDRLKWTPEDAVSKRPSQKFRGGGRHQSGNPRPCPAMKPHPNGQAYARWETGGEKTVVYFGLYGSQQARDKYARFCVDWANGQVRAKEPKGGEATLVEAAAGYLVEAARIYRKNGKPTTEYYGMRTAVEVLLANAENEMRVIDYRPDDLQRCMDSLIERGQARETINQTAGRIIRIFKWCAVKGYCGQDLPALLEYVPRVKRGQTEAPEWEKPEPIPEADIVAIFPHLWPGDESRRAMIEAMIRVQWLCGMRPQSVCGMRACDIDRRISEWKYDVPDHINKMAHADRDLTFFLGPKTQAILAPLLADCPPERTVFGFLPARKGRWGEWLPIKRERYARIIAAACVRAGATPWEPRRLRHTHADFVRHTYESVEGAAARIGDTPEVTARVYSRPTEEVARRIAREVG